jgi:thiosulfate dehydrogenase (quinone) large subunit
MAQPPATRPRIPPAPHQLEATPGTGNPASGVADSWKAQSVSIRILRAFLGVTFLYAGIQKLADPNFLHAGSLDYIGAQLKDFAHGSPVAGLMNELARAPVVTGIVIALLEIAVGLGTLLGVAPITAAAIGLVINMVLFLSATWHVHPYFLGSDSIYAVAWAAYLVAVVESRRRAQHTPVVGHRRRSVKQAEIDAQRRAILRAGVLGAGTLLFAGIAKALAGTPSPATPAGGSSGRRTSGGTSVSPSRSPASQGTPIASLDSVPVGGAIAFNAPGTGPAVLLRPSMNSVEAYSRICTHAGCLVGYDRPSKILFCPCHGAEFDPARGAAPIAGPAPTPLRRIPVAIDHGTGKVVVTS